MFATVDKVFPCPDAREGIHSAGVATRWSSRSRVQYVASPLRLQRAHSCNGPSRWSSSTRKRVSAARASTTSPSHQVRCLLTDVPLSRTDLELLTEEFTPCREDCVVLPTACSSFLQQVLLDEPLHIQSSKSLLNELIESKSL